MELETQMPAVDRDMRTALNNNFVKIEQEDEKDDARINNVDTKHDGNETKLDQKYSKITNQIIAKCNDLQEGEDKLDSDKASKVMLYKWWKELDDKFSACVDELDDKKASKKRVRENFQQLSQLIQQFKDQITKQVDDNYKKMNDKAERVAVGSDGPTFIRMLGWALHDPKIRDVVASIVKE